VLTTIALVCFFDGDPARLVSSARSSDHGRVLDARAGGAAIFLAGHVAEVGNSATGNAVEVLSLLDLGPASALGVEHSVGLVSVGMVELGRVLVARGDTIGDVGTCLERRVFHRGADELGREARTVNSLVHLRTGLVTVDRVDSVRSIARSEEARLGSGAEGESGSYDDGLELHCDVWLWLKETG